MGSPVYGAFRATSRPGIDAGVVTDQEPEIMCEESGRSRIIRF